MASDVVIRPAERGDLDAIYAIERASFPAPWRREFFESELTAPGRYTLVAMLNKEVAAYLFAMWIFDEMHINKIAVSEKQRRNGIARALMDHVLSFAREHSVEMISLEVRESNLGAQAFYKQLAFESVYVRPRYYPDNESAVVMTRHI